MRNTPDETFLFSGFTLGIKISAPNWAHCYASSTELSGKIAASSRRDIRWENFISFTWLCFALEHFITLRYTCHCHRISHREYLLEMPVVPRKPGTCILKFLPFPPPADIHTRHVCWSSMYPPPSPHIYGVVSETPQLRRPRMFINSITWHRLAHGLTHSLTRATTHTRNFEGYTCYRT